MKLEEFKLLTENSLINVNDLHNKEDRTLLYGYTMERSTFHVYLKDMKIHTVVYNTDYSGDNPKPKNMIEVEVISNHDYIPDKRLYPERCDYEFCKLLKGNNVHSLPFTTFDTDRHIDKSDFYGFTLEDMEQEQGIDTLDVER